MSMRNSAIRLLEAAAVRGADRVVLEEEERSVTYGQLLHDARVVGTGLLSGRCTAGRPAVIYLPKSIHALTAFFGALCAGSPYAPVDAHIPMARLQKIVDSLQPGCIITNRELLPNLEQVTLGGAQPLLIEELLEGEENPAAVEAAIAAGEWVTISISVYNLGITGMKVQVGDTVITLAGNTSKGQFGANWGLMFGDNPDDTYIKSLTMIAGDNLDAELIWPGEAGENVLAVPQSAIDDGGEENPDDDDDETPGGDDSGEVTDAPTDPADDDQTAAPTDDATGTGETPAEEEGCASVMPAAAGVAAALLLALPLVRRKKED